LNTVKKKILHNISQNFGIYAVISTDCQIRIFLGNKSNEPDILTKILSKLTHYQLYSVLMLVKLLDQQDSRKARDLLIKYPSILRMLFQIEISFGLIRLQPSKFAQSIYKLTIHDIGYKKIILPSTSFFQMSKGNCKSMFGPSQQKALGVIINMTQTEITLLPSEKRNAVLHIREQLGI